MSSKLLEELKRRYDPFIVKNYLIKKYAAYIKGNMKKLVCMITQKKMRFK